MDFLYKSELCELNSLQRYQKTLEASNYQSNFGPTDCNYLHLHAKEPKVQNDFGSYLLLFVISSDDGNDEAIWNFSLFTVGAGNVCICYYYVWAQMVFSPK